MTVPSLMMRWHSLRTGYGWPGRVLAWVLPVSLGIWLVRLVLGSFLPALTTLWAFSLWLILLLVAALAWRAMTHKLLWRVRNRLTVTYLLFGVAPVLLFGTLTLIAAYLFAGQYATRSALRSFETAESELRGESSGLATLSIMNAVPTQAPIFNRGRTAQPATRSAVELAVNRNGTWGDIVEGHHGPESTHSAFAGKVSPAWLQPGFQGLVDLEGRIYIVSETEVVMGGHSALVLASLPVTTTTLSRMADGLGRITLTPGYLGMREPSEMAESGEGTRPEDNEVAARPEHPQGETTFHPIGGGLIPPAEHLWDIRVLFAAPLAVQNWNSGLTDDRLILVTSRPTLLYRQLFSNSERVGRFVAFVLLTMGGLAVLIECIAVFMAIGLSRTITRSVASLSQGTMEIDRGNFAYRIHTKSRDQLGALAASFNTMTRSMQDLLAQQREKERLESELAIAHEVQTNLFPASPLRRDGILVHAICLPARVVSGDYFDFFCDHGQVCVALGDISGKGISAALLMASLHSSVRLLGATAHAQADREPPSPAYLLGIINEQMLHSTQPERYATAFLAFFNQASRTLTYTNCGHLAPWLLSSDGTCRSLETGGPVLGLLGGLRYQQATVDCHPGDLLIAYSDGLTEAESEEGEFGEARLLEFLQRHRDLPLEDLAASATASIQQWTGMKDQVDDMTILLARVQ